MCDYSLEQQKSRPARVGDRLEACTFVGTLTHGLRDVDGPADEAVCLMPGTELAFDECIQSAMVVAPPIDATVGRFREVDADNPFTHHDALELPDGRIVKIADLVLGQVCTVLQLPAETQAESALQEEQAEEFFAQ